MKNIKYAWTLLLLWGSACSSVQILSDYDKEIDFSNYKTFKLADAKDIEPGDEVLHKLNQNRVRKAITEQMVLRGYTGSDAPDLIVNIYAKVTSKTQVYTSDPYFPYYGYYRFYGHRRYYNYWGLGWSYADVDVRDYKEGTLIIDLVDAKKDQLVWHGVAVGTVSDLSKDPEARINDVVKRMFDKYPYVAGSNHSMISSRE